VHSRLDHHLVSELPAQLLMGELPRDYEDVSAEVIVNLCGVFPPQAPLGAAVLTFTMHDSLDRGALPRQAEVERFLAAVHVLARDRSSYWHCHAGLNRSGFAVAAYLHLYRGLRISEAIAELRRARSPMVLCNRLFEETLRHWYGDEDEHAFEPVPLDEWLSWSRP
jgi:hypothetical protein